MPRWTGVLWLALLALLFVSCEETARTGDGGEEGDAAGPGCPYDQNIDFDTAQAVKAGDQVTGYLCPKQDQDFYKIDVPAGSKLLHIQLNYVTPVPRLNLTYTIFDSDKKTPLEAAGSGIYNKFDALHCLTKTGTLYVVVKDNGDDDYDNMNAYTFSYSTESDKDTNEPNDDPQSATAISGSATGYISCQKDVDYFKVNVGADQLLKVGLKPSKATSVDLQYTVYDSTNGVVILESIPDGTKPDAKIEEVHHVPAAGTYYIAVQDMDDNESDATTSYTLTVSTQAEPDAQDKGTRNDRADNATVVGSGGSGLLSKTYTGQIASKGDVDYFVINGLTGVSENNPAVMEVILSYGAGQVALDPGFSMIYTDPAQACTKDTCCNVLTQSPCVDNSSCLRKTFSCVPKGDIFCNDATCVASPSATCPTERACAGAAVCMPNKTCGAEHALRVERNKTAATTVKTAQLLVHPGPWYVRVSDQGDDEYENGRTYTLSIKVQMDPDGAKELDTELFADRFLLVTDKWDEEMEWKAHVVQAKTKIASKQITLGQPFSGYISYEGDIDFYRIDNPCPDADCTLAIDYNTQGCPSSGAPIRYCQDPKEVSKYMGLELLVSIRRTDSEASQWFGHVVSPNTTGTWGAPATCVYSYKSHGSSPYYITVEDMGQNYWSWGCKYTFTVRKVADGCAAPCQVHPVSGNCGA